MRIVSVINRSLGCKAKVYYNSEYSEYVVKYWDCDGVQLSESTFYYTDDKDDAISTAHRELDFMIERETI